MNAASLPLLTQTPPNPTLGSDQEPKPTTKASVVNTAQVDIQERILDELRRLNALQVELASDPSLKTQAVWNFLLQAFGLIAGTLFGIFAILASKAATQANSMTAKANNLADTANHIALAAYCQPQSDGSNDFFCSQVRSVASSSILAYASSLYGVVPESTSSTSASSMSTSTSTPSSIPPDTGSGSPSEAPEAGKSKAVITAAVVGSLGSIILLGGAAILPYRTFKSRECKSQRVEELSRGHDQRQVI